MVPKEEAHEDGNSLSSARTSESSDSYSYLLHGFDSPGNRIAEEWEAIERTLYQENGKHVTDPTLLKECKLWRETFPHIRVKGTAIQTIQESGCNEKPKDVEVKDSNKLALSKINDKREKIKKTVVSQIVDKLINKLNLNAAGWENRSDTTNKLMELNGKEDKRSVLNMKSSGVKQEKESYFERGKCLEAGGILKYGNVRTNYKDSLLDIFDDFEYEPNKTGNSARTGSVRNGYNYSLVREQNSSLAKNEEIMRSGNIKFEIAEKHPSSYRLKNEKPSNSLSSIHKPFEATKKIDKKYEALLERILENKGIPDHERSPLSKSCGDSLEQRRELNSTRRIKELPKINSFTNNWLSRAEENLSDPYGYKESVARTFSIGNTTRSPQKRYKSEAVRKSSNTGNLEEKLLEELRKEVDEFRISSKKDYEGIKLERPKLHGRCNQTNKGKTQKPSSCSDLTKKNPKTKVNRVLKNTLEKGKSELTVKSGGKRTAKSNGNQNVQLPPIETSIICTEITSRPNASVRTFTKKHL